MKKALGFVAVASMLFACGDDGARGNDDAAKTKNAMVSEGEKEDAPAASNGSIAPSGAPAIDVLDCATDEGYAVSTHRASVVGDTEVNVIGIYETRPDHDMQSHPQGTASVRVTRHAKQILVLSSYEPTEWNVTLEAGASVEKIVTVGYHDQIVNAPAGVAIEKASVACGYSWPYNGEGCDTNQLFERASATAKAPVAAFAGCYRANSFVVRDEEASVAAPALN